MNSRPNRTFSLERRRPRSDLERLCAVGPAPTGLTTHRPCAQRRFVGIERSPAIAGPARDRVHHDLEDFDIADGAEFTSWRFAGCADQRPEVSGETSVSGNIPDPHSWPWSAAPTPPEAACCTCRRDCQASQQNKGAQGMLTRAAGSLVPEPQQRDRRCAETDRQPLQETTAAADRRSGPRHAVRPGNDHISQPCINACGDLDIDSLQERCHQCIPVLRA